MNIEIRKYHDYRETENLAREAFWDVYKPGCDEHLVLHQIRQSKAFIQEMDYIACDSGRIVGNIVYTRAFVKDDDHESEVLCMGPICVLPSYQRKGIGTLLLRTTIEKAKSLRYKAIVIFGDPAYYHKFGFSNAELYGIATARGDNFDAFMVLELFRGGLDGIHGRFYTDSAFEINQEELEAFDSQFPYREKHTREGQLK
jgi:predicted N-acetyltransferase YhbS